jgi:spore cortex biosynthesis protein YabQ
VDDLAAQVYRLLVMALAGIGAGLGFDLFRAWRGFAHPRGWAVHLSDLAFLCFASVLLAVALVYGNWGDLRLYVGLGFALGAAIYFKLGSPFLLRLFVRLFRLLGSIIDGTTSWARSVARSLARITRRLVTMARRAAPRLPPGFLRRQAAKK